MKKLSLLLAVLMLAAAVAGCGGGTTPPAADTPAPAAPATPAPAAPAAPAQAEEDENPLDLAKGRDISFTYWYPWGSGRSQDMIGTLNNNHVYIEMERLTGIKVEFLIPAAGQETEQFNLIIASGDYPDIVTQAERYRGGTERGLMDGVYIDITKAIEDWAPNYMKLLELSAPLKKQVYTDSGYFQGFGMVTSDNFGEDWTPSLESPWPGPFIRGDWLEGVGLDIPTNIPEWYEALTAIKNEYNPEVLLSKRWKMRDDRQGGPAFLAAFGGPLEFFMGNDGKISYGPANDFFGEYLTEMAKWYSEGLIDQEFAARDQNQINQLEANLQMAAKQYDGTAFIIRTRNFAAELNSDAFLVGAPYPTKDANTPLNWRYQNHPCRGDWTMFFDTPNANQYLEELVRWFDYGYSAEGAQLYNFGLYGETWSGLDEKGFAIYADYITADNYAAFEQYQEVVRRHNGPYLKSDLRSMFRRRLPELEVNREIWQAQPNPSFLPPYTLNDDEGREAASILADIESFVDEALVRYIMGLEPAANAMTVPETVRNMNIARVLELHEQALARYNAR